MSYEVKYTDDLNKGAIIVEDNTINTETTLGLPGKFANGYGQTVAENFLHLLENFASTEAPLRPVEGQLWYDTNIGIDQLKIYDGTNWVASGGLKKSTSEPSTTTSNAGDLWSNTDTQQLFLYNGSSWVLVGPEYSDGLLTGGRQEIIVGADDVSYSVYVIKVNNVTKIIISASAFRPKLTIAGFSTINPGINLATNTKYYGVAESAESLNILNTKILASNFLRSDVESTTNYRLRVKSNDGIQIGANNQFNVNVSNEAGIIQHNTVGSNIDIRLRDENTFNTVMRIDSSKRVGINTNNPQETLDVVGNIRLTTSEDDSTSGVMHIESIIESTDITEGSLIVEGGTGIALNLNVGGNASINGDLVTTNIVPDQSVARNIGSLVAKYNDVFAQRFVGTLQGNVTGNVTGKASSADRLTTSTLFSVTGDIASSAIAYNGSQNSIQLDVTINDSFVTSKNSLTAVSDSDELLINKPIANASYEPGIYKVSKANFLKSLPTFPVGMITPYGGTEAPVGWLLCDGSEKNKSEYTALWLAIGYNFKAAIDLSDGGVNKFAIPDLRGRSLVGIDSMGGSSANRVTDTNADVIGGTGGLEDTVISIENIPDHSHDLTSDAGYSYYAVRAGTDLTQDPDSVALSIDSTDAQSTLGYNSSGKVETRVLQDDGDPLTTDPFVDITLSTPLNVMNPFMAVNYIIYTGQ